MPVLGSAVGKASCMAFNIEHIIIVLIAHGICMYGVRSSARRCEVLFEFCLFFFR